jgi:cation diffusion facilitator CzcD-associated flavoprotein CzcO
MGRPKVFLMDPILKYINEAADEYKVRDHIIYQQALFLITSIQKKLWTVTTVNTAQRKTVYTCQFIFSCSGYYNYTKGYTLNLKIKPALKEK